VLLEGRHGSLAAARFGQCARGAHAGDDFANQHYFGIESEGNFEHEFLMTAEQWGALACLCAWLAHWGDFDTQNIWPHRQFKATACPGLLADRLDHLRAEAHDLKVRIRAAT
jgi:hypothetical protein